MNIFSSNLHYLTNDSTHQEFAPDSCFVSGCFHSVSIVPVKKPWRTWVNRLHEFIRNSSYVPNKTKIRDIVCICLFENKGNVYKAPMNDNQGILIKRCLITYRNTRTTKPEQLWVVNKWFLNANMNHISEIIKLCIYMTRLHHDYMYLCIHNTTVGVVRYRCLFVGAMLFYLRQYNNIA